MSVNSERSILSSSCKGLKKKNKLTINSLPIVFVTVLLLALIYCFVLLLCLGGTNKAFAIGVICFNFGWVCVQYPLIHEASLRDRKVRAIIFNFLFSFLLGWVSVNLFPSLAGPLPNQEINGGKIALLVVGIEIISKQLMSFTSDTLNYMIEGPSTKSWLEFVKFKMTWCLIQFVLSLVEAILLFAMVLPVTISQLDLSEWLKVVIFGIIFPLFRFLCGKVLMIALLNMDKVGGFHDKESKLKLIFSINIGVTLCFGATSLFSMLSTSPTILLFSIQYIPHAFASKFSWMKNISFIDTKIKKIESSLYYFFCFCNNKQVVNPQVGEKLVRRESIVTKAIRRASTDILKIVDGNDKSSSIDNNNNNNNNNNTNNNEKDENELDLIENDGNYVMILEAVSVIADKLAIIAYLMALLHLLFFTTDSSSDVTDFQRLIQAIICVFGVVFIFDQISAIWGFAMIEYQGIELDTDLGLGDGNPLNTIRTFNSGHRWKAIGDLLYMSSFCMCVFLSIAFAQTVRLF